MCSRKSARVVNLTESEIVREAVAARRGSDFSIAEHDGHDVPTG